MNKSQEFYDKAFARSEGDDAVPADIRAAAEHICNSYPINGICDPMYIANAIAMHTGRGDGQSHFSKDLHLSIDRDLASSLIATIGNALEEKRSTATQEWIDETQTFLLKLVQLASKW